MTLSVLEGRFIIACLLMCDFFVFYTFDIAFHVAVMGEDRNFKFSTDIGSGVKLA